MAQPPFRVDALEIVGDSGVGARLLEATTAGELRLTDPTVSRRLGEIVGLQGVDGVVIVGSGDGVSKQADGAQVTTLQDALDQVPTSASVSSPWLVLVMPGVYHEHVFHDRDGVHVFGLGNVVVRNVGNHDTYTVLRGPFSTPRRVTFQNIRFENTSPNHAAVVVTSALFATGTITVGDIAFIGDTVSVDGNTLTAVATGSTPAAGEFALGSTFDETAENLAAAINNPINAPLSDTVKALVSGTVVTVQALEPGLVGNAITLATSVPATFVLSGATLTGGLDETAGSEVASGTIRFLSCDLVATDATGMHLRCEAVNNIYVSGGDWLESSTGAQVVVRECARFECVAVHLRNLDLRYDINGPLPSLVTSQYVLHECQAQDLSYAEVGGDGVLTLAGGSYRDAAFAVTTTVTADRVQFESISSGQGSLTLRHSGAGTLTLTGTSTCVARNCVFETITPSGPGPTLDIDTLQFTVDFTASLLEAVTLPVEQPDALYHVYLDSSLLGDIPVVSQRSVSSFDVEFNGVQTTTVGALLRRFP